MPLITQKFIYRSDLQRNPDVWYLFGDNTQRVGLGGQAKEMRGEPNAIGIATKRQPSQYENSYFSDREITSNCKIIKSDLNKAIARLLMGDIVVLPEDGLGTGLSELPERAPETNSYLEDMLKLMKGDFL